MEYIVTYHNPEWDKARKKKDDWLARYSNAHEGFVNGKVDQDFVDQCREQYKVFLNKFNGTPETIKEMVHIFDAVRPNLAYVLNPDWDEANKYFLKVLEEYRKACNDWSKAANTGEMGIGPKVWKDSRKDLLWDAVHDLNRIPKYILAPEKKKVAVTYANPEWQKAKDWMDHEDLDYHKALADFNAGNCGLEWTEICWDSYIRAKNKFEQTEQFIDGELELTDDELKSGKYRQINPQWIVAKAYWDKEMQDYDDALANKDGLRPQGKKAWIEICKKTLDNAQNTLNLLDKYLDKPEPPAKIAGMNIKAMYVDDQPSLLEEMRKYVEEGKGIFASTPAKSIVDELFNKIPTMEHLPDGGFKFTWKMNISDEDKEKLTSLFNPNITKLSWSHVAPSYQEFAENMRRASESFRRAGFNWAQTDEEASKKKQARNNLDGAMSTMESIVRRFNAIGKFSTRPSETFLDDAESSIDDLMDALAEYREVFGE